MAALSKRICLIGKRKHTSIISVINSTGDDWIKTLSYIVWYILHHHTFWKSNFKQQLGCKFDIMDNESYFFVFWHMQLYMSWYIRSFFGFTFLNILYFSSTLVLTSSIDVVFTVSIVSTLVTKPRCQVNPCSKSYHETSLDHITGSPKYHTISGHYKGEETGVFREEYVRITCVAMSSATTLCIAN